MVGNAAGLPPTQYCETRMLIAPDQPTFCRLAGREDLYGLGIRLGTYLIWASSALATSFATNTAESTRNLNSCFQGATLLALIYAGTAQDSEVFAFEAYILVNLCFGGIFTSVLLPQSASLKQLKTYITNGAVTAAELLRLMIATACSVYGAWFSFDGLNNFCRSLCGNDIFFFAKIGLFGDYRTFLNAMFTFLSFFLVPFVAWSLFLTFKNLRPRLRTWQTNKPSVQQAETVLNLVPLLCGVVIIILGVMAAEFPISWNAVGGVDTCTSLAQMFPIVIGGGSLVRTIYHIALNLTRDNAVASAKSS